MLPLGAGSAESVRPLADCVAELTARGGGWCEMPGTIAEVWPANLTQTQKGGTGPATVLTGLNGAAWDRQDLKVYFHGGGAGDYGGNEVYEFDLKSGKWSRLTDPGRYPPVPPKGPGALETACLLPLHGPPASRVFDGLFYSRETRTVWSAPTDFHCPQGRQRARQELWEFNPSRAERRHDLAPLTWRKHTILARNGPLGTAERADGSFYLGGRGQILNFDPHTARLVGDSNSIGDLGVTNVTYDARRDIVWVLSRRGLYSVAGLKAERRSGLPAGLTAGSGIAVNRDGMLVFWDGRGFIHTYDAERREWRLHEAPGAPPAGPIGRVFGKWAYLPSHDVFVGVNSHQTGVWVYRHPAGARGIAVNRTPIQRYIDRAPPGGAVTVPPGVYPAGAKIVKPLTLRMKGVRILGNTGRKAIVNIRIDGGPVIIEDFTATDSWGCSSGNCAGIKVEGIDFNVTLRRVHIANQVMGVLTDNRGGRLVIEDSVIEEQGHPGGALSHLVYAGRIGKLVIRDSILRRSRRLGHILKSRAAQTRVENSFLLGLDGNHSRSIDIPCGGVLTVHHSVIQHGSRSDNADLFGIGLEQSSCGNGVIAADVSLTDNWIISDRRPVAGDSTDSSSPNTLFTWRFSLDDRLRTTGNRVVNIGRWQRDWPWGIPDITAGNTIYPDRNAAGLGPHELPRLRGRR